MPDYFIYYICKMDMSDFPNGQAMCSRLRRACSCEQKYIYFTFDIHLPFGEAMRILFKINK